MATQRKARTQSGTDQPQRLALAGNVMYRNADINKDQRLINCFQESLKNELTNTFKSFVVKRPGLQQELALPTGEGRGIAYFAGYIYSVVEDKLYRDDVEILTLNTTTGAVGFLEFDNVGLRYLFLCDGIDGYRIKDDGTVDQINVTYNTWQASTTYAEDDMVVPTTDNGYYYTATTVSGDSGNTEPAWPTALGGTVVDGGITWTCTGGYGGFPSPHVPTPLFIDGYMLLPRTDSQDVYNSDVDNIFGWNAANFVTAEIFPDNVVALARQNNQVIAFGGYSSEFLFDAATTSGSPFARNEAAVLQMGNGAPYAIYQNEKFCCFVGQSESGGRAAWLVDGFNPKKISTEYIERLLDAEGTNLQNARGYGLRTKGHLFYFVRLTDTTIVYDLEEKVWHEWRSGEDLTTFDIVAVADKLDGKSIGLDASTGEVFVLSPTNYSDDDEPISMNIYTSKYDANNMFRKFMGNLTVVGDQVPAEKIYFRWSDDDYQTWSNWKEIDLGSTRPYFARLGLFRRRAFHLRYLGDTDWRAEALEFNIDQGVG